MDSQALPERVCPRCRASVPRDATQCPGCRLSLEPGVVFFEPESRTDPASRSRAIEPGYGRWVFPGGYVDRGETLEDAAVREAREECGLDVELEGIVSLHSYRGRTPIVIVYAARAVGGSLTVADDESLEVRTFSAGDVPWDALAFDSTHEALETYFGGGDGSRPAQRWHGICVDTGGKGHR